MPKDALISIVYTDIEKGKVKQKEEAKKTNKESNKEANLRIPAQNGDKTSTESFWQSLKWENGFKDDKSIVYPQPKDQGFFNPVFSPKSNKIIYYFAANTCMVFNTETGSKYMINVRTQNEKELRNIRI